MRACRAAAQWFMLTRSMMTTRTHPPCGRPRARSLPSRGPLARLLCALWLITSVHAAEPPGLLAGFSRDQLLLTTAAKGCTLIDVYVAETPDQRARGLMHVRAMDSHEGMVFVYPREDVIHMWMKNTWLPLDMLFADGSGRILHLHRDARPHDETVISSRLAVSYVVELNAGSIERFGIRTGDTIGFPAP